MPRSKVKFPSTLSKMTVPRPEASPAVIEWTSQASTAAISCTSQRRAIRPTSARWARCYAADVTDSNVKPPEGTGALRLAGDKWDRAGVPSRTMRPAFAERNQAENLNLTRKSLTFAPLADVAC